MYRVIIVEDDPMVASINKQYVELNRNLSVVAHFTTGAEALTYLSTNPVDLIILDLYMPIMNGMEVLEEIRRQKLDVDVIMVTAASDTNQIKRLLSLGVLDYLVKPFEYVRFNHALAVFMQHKELLCNKDSLDQTQIDSLLNCTESETVSSDLLSKGLQQKTLSLILNYMKEQKRQPLTSEQIAENVHLSRVTVRRYMNYLLETQEIKSDIDYTTGGRPSIIYQYMKES